MLDENALGEYMGPECFPIRKHELQSKTNAKKNTPPRTVLRKLERHNWKGATDYSLGLVNRDT